MVTRFQTYSPANVLTIPRRGPSLYRHTLVIVALFASMLSFRAEATVITQTWNLDAGSFPGPMTTITTFQPVTLLGIGVEDVVVDSFTLDGPIGIYNAVFATPGILSETSDLAVRFIDGQFSSIVGFSAAFGTLAGTDLFNATNFKLDMQMFGGPNASMFSLWRNGGLEQVGVWSLQSTQFGEATAVPEPSLVALMLVGILLFAIGLRRRRVQAPAG